jgi:hypothetical protein
MTGVKLCGMAKTAAQRLALFEDIRDKVESALAAGAPVVSYSVDGQTVQKEPTSAWLAELDARIADLRSQAGAGLPGRRNLVRFQR